MGEYMVARQRRVARWLVNRKDVSFKNYCFHDASLLVYMWLCFGFDPLPWLSSDLGGEIKLRLFRVIGDLCQRLHSEALITVLILSMLYDSTRDKTKKSIYFGFIFIHFFLGCLCILYMYRLLY